MCWEICIMQMIPNLRGCDSRHEHEITPLFRMKSKSLALTSGHCTMHLYQEKVAFTYAASSLPQAICYRSRTCARQAPCAILGLFRKRKRSTPVLDTATEDRKLSGENSGATEGFHSERQQTGTETEMVNGRPASADGEASVSNIEPMSVASAGEALAEVMERAFRIPEVPLPPPDPNTVLVLGSSGRLGSLVVRELLKKPGCVVIACVQSMSRADESGLVQLADEVAKKRDGCDFGQRPSRLEFFVADVTTEATQIANCVRQKGVGAVVYAASGGPRGPALVDNTAVGTLARELEPILGAEGEARELRIFDFELDGEKTLMAFRSVDDRVMGGVSSSEIVLGKDRFAIFKGEVTTASNGGFAQVRGNFGLDQDGESLRLDLSQYAGITIRCRGDGRRYKLNLKDDERPEFAYQVSFATVKGEWQVLRFPFSAFIPVRRGRIAYRDGAGLGIYESTLDTARVVSVGLVVSKIEPGGGATPGFTSGPFELEVAYVSAYRASTPKFVLVSAAAVTRPFWSEEKRLMNRSVVDIPIVNLNPGNILGNKLAGENRLRRSSVPWAIIRPTGLSDAVAEDRKLVVGQGDVMSGRVNRADVARGIVSALRTEAATWKTIEMTARDADVTACKGLAPEDFAKLEMDDLEEPYANSVEASFRSR